MNRLPVFGVFWRSINFAILDFPTIVRLTWLPLSLIAIYQTAGTFALYDNAVLRGEPGHVPWSPGPQFQPVYEAFLATFIVALPFLQILSSTAAAVVLHRVVLFDDRQPGRYLVFPFGWTEILYVAMLLLWGLIGFAVAIPFILAVSAFAPPQNALDAVFQNGGFAQVQLASWAQTVADEAQRLTPVQALLMVVTLFAMFVFFLWLSIRLFVWPAALVARRKLSLGYAWGLTQGNAWAIFGLYLLSIVLFVGVSSVLTAMFPAAMNAPQLNKDPARPNIELEDKTLESMGVPAGPSAPEKESSPAKPEAATPSLSPLPAVQTVPPEQGQPVVVLFLINSVLSFILNFFVVGYSIALISFSYRALNGENSDGPAGH